MRTNTRYPIEGEALIFSEYVRPRIITLDKGIIKYHIVVTGTGTVKYAIGYYKYNGIDYPILGDYKTSWGKNQILEHFIEAFWGELDLREESKAVEK